MPEPVIEPPFDCTCNWCGRDFQTTNVITNTCPDCRSAAQRAYDKTLHRIRAARDGSDAS